MTGNLVELRPVVSPTAVMQQLMLRIETDWAIKTAFSPSLDYEEAMTNMRTDHIAKNDRGDHALQDSIFAYRRSSLRHINGLGFAMETGSWCPDQGTLDATFYGSFDIEFKAFFSDMQSLEAFEIGYMANHVIKCLTNFGVVEVRNGVLEPKSEAYNLEWSVIENLDFSLKPNNFMSLDFKTTIDGTWRSPVIEATDVAAAPKDILTLHFNSLLDT